MKRRLSLYRWPIRAVEELWTKGGFLPLWAMCLFLGMAAFTWSGTLQAQNTWEVTVSSPSWGDATTWTLENSSNVVILSGGTYGNGYSDTQTVGVDPADEPLTFTITSTLGDNSPNYSISCFGTVISGNLPANTSQSFPGLACNPPPPCLPPVSPSVGAVTESTAEVNWACAGCTGDFYVEYGSPGFTPGLDANPGTGTVAGPFASGPQTLTGLSSGTAYEFVVRQDCGVDGFSTNTAAEGFSTTCAIYATPYFEGFEGLGETTNATWPISSCIVANPVNTTTLLRWDRDANTTISGSTGPNGPFEGGLYAFLETSSGAAGSSATLDLGPVDLSALTVPALTFYYHMFGATMGTLNVLVSTDGITFNPEWSLSGQQQTSGADPWAEVLLPLPAYAGQTITIRFEGIRGTSFTGDMAIDAISVDEAPSCFPPVSTSIGALTANTADVDWDCPGCTGDFYVEYGAPGFTPGTDANPGTGTVIGPFAGGPQTIGGLTGATNYEFVVRQECTPGDWSNNTAPSGFTTPCDTETTPWSEGFEGFATSLNATWPATGCIIATPANTTTLYRWNQRTGSTPSNFSTGPLGAHEGTIYAFTEGSSGAAGAVATLDMPLVDLSALSDPALTFYYHMWTSAANPAEMGTLNVLVSTDGVSYNNEFSVSGPQQAAQGDPYFESIVSLSAYAGQVVYIRFEGIRGTSFNSDIAIDAISVDEAPTCFTPTDIAATVVDANTVDVSWDCAGCTGVFYVEYGAPGFTPGVDANPGTGTVVGPIAGNSTQVGGLTADTNYAFRVRQDCDVDGFSNNSAAASAFTGYCQGGPTSTNDSNAGEVSGSGLGGSSFVFDHCAPPGGPDQGYLGVLDQTALSIDVADGFGGSVTLEVAACDNSTFTNQHEIWVDWNGNLTYEPGESIGSGSGNPVTETYAVVPPPGTPVGTYRMRVMVQETAAVPPLNPCASYTWGSMTEFSVNVVPPPACTQPTANFNISPDCGIDEFSILVDLTSVGDSPGGEVSISNSFDANVITNATVGGSPYTVGPFPAGNNVIVTVEHLGDPVCNIASNAIGTTCAACASGPTTTADSNVELVDISGFAGSGFTHVGCSPPVIGVEDLTALSVDIPNGFSYDLQVDFGSCGGNFGAAGSVWVDWNGDFVFSPGELIGSTTLNPSSEIFTVSPPPGTPEGPKVMRVMMQEGGTLPLNPCGTFTWGSVMDFTVNVIADPGCVPPSASLAVDASSCSSPFEFEYFIEVTINSVGDSPGGEVTISNSFDGNTIPNATVAGSPYVYGPFPSGTVMDVNLEHLGNALCTFTTGFTHDCPPPNDLCANATVIPVNDQGECMGAAVSASTAEASTDGPTATCLIAGLTDVWFEFTTGSSPYINWEITLGTMEAIGVEIWDDCPGVGSSIYCLADATSDPNTLVLLEANTTYLFRVLTLPQFSGSFDICIETGPDSPGDSCSPEFSATAGETIAEPPLPCNVAQGGPGYPLDPTCEAAICGADAFCCSTSWDGICADDAAVSPSCAGCLDVSGFATTTESTLDVLGPFPGGDIIIDLDVVVTIQHPDVSELLIELESPCGTKITLQNEQCAGGTNMNAYFDDDSNNDFTTFCTTRIGDVQPDESLLTFNNEPIIGTWTLHVTDLVAGNAGTITDWCLVPTLDDGCPPPPVAIVDFTDTSISVDVGANPCYDISNYESYSVDWGTGSESGITTLPYTITGLTPGTNYNISFSGVCTGGIPSGSSGISQYTLNCDVSEVCSYELTLTNNNGTGFDGAFVQVNNGWFTADYTLSTDQSTNTFTIDACPGNPLSVSLVNGNEGGLGSEYNVTLVNASLVEVLNQNGPPEAQLYFTTDGCPDCAAVQNIGFSRLAADLVDVTWSNVELVGNVDDILVEVYIDDIFGNPILIGTETVAAGSTSASVALTGSYPFESVFVLITTNCTNEGAGLATSLTVSLPACDSADQCEYAFDMTSAIGGWGNSGLDVLLDGSTNVLVTLPSGSSGTQSVYACSNGTIDVSGINETGGACDITVTMSSPSWGDATTWSLTDNDGVSVLSGGTYGNGYSDTQTLPGAANGPYTLTIISTLGDNSPNYEVQTDGNVVFSGTGAPNQTTVVGPIVCGGSGGACGDLDFSLTLNPGTDDVTLIPTTDFCAFEDDELIFSSGTCPTCFTPNNATVQSVGPGSVDISWFSNNPAGTDYTIYVGLPGFTPGVDEVSTASGVTAATGTQAAVTVSGLAPFTTYEALVIEDCDNGNDPTDPSNTVAFTTPIDNDDCADVTPVPYSSPNILVFNGSSVGANDNSLNGSYGAAQAWEAFTLTNCAQNLRIEYCGSVPVLGTVFNGISTGCPAEFPTNYLFADESSFPTNPNLANCPDGNPVLLYEQLSAGTYYIPVFEGIGAYQITITSDQCEGCTDPLAINYDPEAEVDDGSCFIPGCDFPTLSTTVFNDCLSGTFTVDLEIGTNGDATDYDVSIGGSCDITVNVFSASWGDATTWTLTDNDGATVLSGGTYGNGYNDTQTLVGADNSPYTLTIVSTLGDNTPNYQVLVDGSVVFSGTGLANNTTVVGPIDCGEAFVGTFNGGDIVNVGPFNIGSTGAITVEHNDDPDCNQTVNVTSNIICGCTNPAALNFSPLAQEDDGSCIVPDCTDPPTPFTYCYGNNENVSFEFAPTTPGDDIIITVSQGTVESTTFDNLTIYDGNSAAAPVLYTNPTGITQLDGLVIQSTNGNGLFITLTTDISVSCQSTGTYNEIIADVYCGFLVIPGCTDANAVNYDPDATLDDGSCVFAPSNDDCVDAQTLTPVEYPNTQNTLGTLTAASADGSSACVGTNGPDVFYTFNVPFENHYWVNLNPFSGFAGVVEVLDACDGTVVACENAPASAPFCDVNQGTPGFPSDPGCEASVCAGDAFCCSTSWDGICAGDAAIDPNCVNCLSTAPAGSGPISVFIQNLPAGDYIVRVRDYYGTAYLSPAQFLVNVQYFPVGQVQDNPANFLFACDQTVQLEDLIGASPQTGQLPGVLDYEWWIAEEGGTFQNFWVRGAPNYSSKPTWLDMQYAGITYNVFVRLLLDIPGEGPVWGVFPQLLPDPHAVGASFCTITTSNEVTLTEVHPNYTPTNLQGNAYAMCNVAVAVNVADAENFEWEFDDGINPPVYYQRGTGNPSVKLSWIDCLTPNTTYNVRVRAQVNGIWANFGPTRIMDMAPTAFTALRPNICNTTRLITQNILPVNICIADQFEYELTNVNTLEVHTIISTTLSGAGALNSATPPLVPGETYSVRVKATQCGVEGDFSSQCDITIAGPQAEGEGMPALRDLANTGSSLYPNPNAGSEVRLELQGIGDGAHDVHVVIYDIYGKLISTNNFGHEGTDLSRLIRFDDNLAMGMYMVHVLVDGEQFAVERMVVK